LTKIDFGDLRQNDWIAFLEETTRDMVGWGIELKKSLDSIAPRAVGSKQVPPEQELSDYVQIKSSPDPDAAFGEWMAQKASEHGATVAVRIGLEFIKRNEQRLKKKPDAN